MAPVTLNPKMVILLFVVTATGVVAASVYAAVVGPSLLPLGGHFRGGSGCHLEESGTPVAPGDEAWDIGHEGDSWRATRTLTYRVPLSAAALDLISCVDTGSIDVVAGAAGEALVIAKVHGYATNEATARSLAQDLQPAVVSRPDALSAWHPINQVRYARGVGATMSFRIALPADVALSPTLTTDTGSLGVEGVRLAGIRAHTDTGSIRLEPSSAAGDLDAHTDTGGITARFAVLDSAVLQFGTDTGSIRLDVPDDARHGYRLKASTDTGSIAFDLADLRDDASSRGHRSATTSGYDARAVRVTADLSTDTGGIRVGGA
jgi:hypothetical protein